MGETPTQETQETTQSGQQPASATPRIIETASATTDPDNANSGNTAYIICAVVVVALIALGSILGSVVTTFLRMEAAGALEDYQRYGQSQGYGGGIDPRDYDDLFDDGYTYELDGSTYRVRPGGLD